MSCISSAQGQTSTRASARKGRAIGLDRKRRVVALLLSLVRLRHTTELHLDGGLLSYILNICPTQAGLRISVKNYHKPPQQQSGA